jgi:hypothetical protein
MFEHHINQAFSYILLIYFYDTKVLQILYVTYYKLNAMICVFIYLLKDILNVISCVYTKKCFILKLIYFNLLTPKMGEIHVILKL